MDRFARRVYTVAGIYGLIVMLPQYFLEDRIGRDTPPPITHPEHFYGSSGSSSPGRSPSSSLRATRNGSGR